MRHAQPRSPSTLAASVHVALAVLTAVLLLHAPTGAQSRTQTGFLQPTSTPGTFVGQANPAYDGLCRLVNGLRLLPPCPPTLSGLVPARNVPPSLGKADDLPHLRLDIVLKRIEQNVISGHGLQTVDPLLLWWNFASAAASNQLPDPASDDLSTVAPGPGEVFNYETSPLVMYSGIVANGCGPSTVFDLQLDSRVHPIGWYPLGDVQLSDTVIGNGFYVFSYTIPWAFPTGPITNHADFIVSGEARAYCTAQSSL